MSLHDIPKRKEGVMALCVQQQSEQWGVSSTARSATTAASPSTSTPPSSVYSKLWLFLQRRGLLGNATDAAAALQFDSLRDGLLQLKLQLLWPEFESESGARPQQQQQPSVPPSAKSHGCVAAASVSVRPLLYRSWLQLRKLLRRYVEGPLQGRHFVWACVRPCVWQTWARQCN